MPPKAKGRPPPRPFFSFIHLPTMPPLFSIVRTGIYLTVVLWTAICLAIAVHFHGLLATSDLTRFVPFAIFVCTASFVIFLALLGFGLRKDRNPITTKIELGCLGLAGTLWLALGAFLINSESQSADVECFASEHDIEPLDIGFSTGTYQAQYRVLTAFSLFNVILILGFASVLLWLVLRQHFEGKQEAWSYPVTTYPWFKTSSKPKWTSKLPAPVTAQAGQSRYRSRHQTERGRTGYTEKPLGRGQTRTNHRRERTRNPYKTPDLALPVHDKYRRNASPRR